MRVALALAVVGLAMLSSLAGPTRAHAWRHATVDTDPMTTLYWRTRRVEIRVAYATCEDAPEGSVRSSVLLAMSEWSTAGAGCADLSLVEGAPLRGTSWATNLDGGDPDGENRIVWRQRDWPHAEAGDVIALTTLVFDRSTGAIVDADIDLNGEDYYFTTSDTSGTVVTDVQNTVTHELGHLLGFGHSDVAEATMYGSSTPGETGKRELDGDDVMAMCTVYPYGAPTPRGVGRSSGGLTSASGCGVAPGRGAGGMGAAAAALALLLALVVLGRRHVRLRARGLAAVMVVAASLVALVPGRAHATVVVALDLRQLVDRADEIALVEAIDVRSLRDERGRIVTDTVVRVIERVAGATHDGDTFVIRRLGGVVGDLGMYVEGEARLVPGDRAIVFAKRSAPNAPLRAVGLSQGVLPVRRDVVHPGAEGLVLVRPVSPSQFVPAVAALSAPRPLSDLLSDLRTMVVTARR